LNHLFEQARADLASRLAARRAEIQRGVLTRIYSVSDPTTVIDPEYLYGLRKAVSAAIDYGLAAIELGEKDVLPAPIDLLAQVRRAKRGGVSLDIVMRRLFAGYNLLADFLISEAEQDARLGGAQLKCLTRSQATLFDRLLQSIGDEYERESTAHGTPPDADMSQRVRGLLDGELIDTSYFDYDFGLHHLGVIAKGPSAPEAIRRFGRSLDSRLLCVHCTADTVWAWFGLWTPIDHHRLGRFLSVWPEDVLLAVGEVSNGLAGWRLTHQQAAAALPIALSKRHGIVRYADVALLASIVRDDTLIQSLQTLYLEPLDDGRDGGWVLRETLRAYFSAGRNGSSAAAALGVSRQTVTNRLRTVEERLGRPLVSCAGDVEIALSLDDSRWPS
jgi:hypothetical protein